MLPMHISVFLLYFSLQTTKENVVVCNNALQPLEGVLPLLLSVTAAKYKDFHI